MTLLLVVELEEEAAGVVVVMRQLPDWKRSDDVRWS